MTGDSVFIENNNHLSPFLFYSEKVRESIVRQHPKLAALTEVSLGNTSKPEQDAWIKEQKNVFGPSLELEPM
ncbi:MAG TPA: hypothetical protein PK950_02095 [Candidatus Paceibacterota bacterium]|nr:hypothetical protein [Candidatus Paceibacterota bacterium]